MILTKSDITNINLEKDIQERIDSGDSVSFLKIVPTNRFKRYLKRKYISNAAGQVAGSINIETLESIAVKILFSNTKTPFEYIDDATSVLLIKLCIKELKPVYFSGYRKTIPTGTLQKIKDVISEYKRQGISPDEIRKLELEGIEKQKADDIALIYELYNEKCIENNYKELGDLFAEIAQIDNTDFESKFRIIYKDVTRIYVQGFDEFSTPELVLVNKLASVSGLQLFIYFDYGNNLNLFYHLMECYQNFEKFGFKEIEDTSAIENTNIISKVKDELGLLKHPVSGKNEKLFDVSDKITITETSNRKEEIEFIAGEVRELLTAGKDVRPGDICVVFNNIHNYSGQIRNIWNKYSIPYNLTDRKLLSQATPVISIIGLLEVLENSFYYKDVLKAASSGFFNFEKINFTALSKSVIDLNIISGYDDWIDKLNSGIADYSESVEPQAKSFVITYEKAKKSIQELKKILKPFEEHLTAEAFLANIKALVNDLKIPELLLKYDDPEVVEENIKALSGFLDSLAEMSALMILEFGEKEKFSLRTFIGNIKTAASETRFNLKERAGYGVTITSLNELRGLSFKYLFVGGLVQNDLPLRFSPEIFMSGKFQKAESKHQVKERFHFYQAFQSFINHLYISYPQFDDKTVLAPSIFLSELKAIFKVNEIRYRPKGVYTKDKMLEILGSSEADNFLKYIKQSEDYQKITTLFKDDLYCSGSFETLLLEIKRGVENQKKRKDEEGSPFSGIIFDELSEELKERISSLAEKNFSITQLETYAKCPFRYFLSNVLYVKEAAEPTDEIDARTSGTIIHSILQNFFETLKEEKLLLNNCSEKDFAKALRIITKIAKEELAKPELDNEKNFLIKEKILGINGDIKNSIIFKYLEFERERNDNYIPHLFEFEFGKLNKEDDVFKIGDIKLRGKIDRIDIDRVNKKIRVIDYKSGAPTPSKDYEEQLALQMPVYMRAAEKKISEMEREEYVAETSEVISLKINKVGDKTEISDPEVIKDCIDSIGVYVDGIKTGKFNLTEYPDRTGICEYCNFGFCCRVNEDF